MTIDKNDEKELSGIREQLRSVFPPVRDSELTRDLWPLMLRRIEATPLPAFWPLRVPWFDWALLALTGAVLIFFPALLPALLYHL